MDGFLFKVAVAQFGFKVYFLKHVNEFMELLPDLNILPQSVAPLEAGLLRPAAHWHLFFPCGISLSILDEVFHFNPNIDSVSHDPYNTERFSYRKNAFHSDLFAIH